MRRPWPWRISSDGALETGSPLRCATSGIGIPKPLSTWRLSTRTSTTLPVPERTGLLGHVRSFLKIGGRLLLTTLCPGRGSTAAVLDLWGAMTTGCGRRPEPTELVAQLEEAGFSVVTARSLIPGVSFYAFVGTNLGSHEG